MQNLSLLSNLGKKKKFFNKKIYQCHFVTFHLQHKIEHKRDLYALLVECKRTLYDIFRYFVNIYMDLILCYFFRIMSCSFAGSGFSRLASILIFVGVYKLCCRYASNFNTIIYYNLEGRRLSLPQMRLLILDLTVQRRGS